MANRTELIRLEGVEKHYHRQSILKIDHLQLFEYDWITINGSNGSGKSTLLRALATISSIDKGKIWRHPSFHNARVSYLPQSGGLYGEFSVAENLRIRRNLYGLSTHHSNPFYLSLLGLTPIMEKRVSELSGGYQRLVAIAACLHTEPDYLLLDEPFYGIDATKCASIQQALKQLRPTIRLAVICSPIEEEVPYETRQLSLNNGQLT